MGGGEERAVVRRVDLSSPAFQRTFGRLPPDIKKQATAAIRALLTPPPLPHKLHFHPLKDLRVKSAVVPKGPKVKVYTIHLTRNDAYKASFTLEDGVAYFRACGTHHDIDKDP